MADDEDSDEAGGSGVIQKTLTGLLREDAVKNELAKKLEAAGKKAIYAERDANASYNKSTQNWAQVNANSPQSVPLNDSYNKNMYDNDNDNDNVSGLPPRVPTEVEDYQRVQSTSPQQGAQQVQQQDWSQQDYSQQNGQYQQQTQQTQQQMQQMQQMQQQGVGSYEAYEEQPGTEPGGAIPPPMMSSITKKEEAIVITSNGVSEDTEEWAFEESTRVYVSDGKGNGNYTNLTMSELKSKILNGELNEMEIKVSLNNGNNWINYNSAKERMEGKDKDEYDYVIDPNYDVNNDPVAQEAKKQGKPLPKPPKKRVRKNKTSNENDNNNNNNNKNTKKKDEIAPGFEPGESDEDVKPPSSGCCVIL